MNGIYAFLLGILAIIGAFVFGKAKGTSDTKTKISGQVTIEKKKAEKAETEKELVTQAAQTVREHTAETDAIDGYFEEFRRDYVEAQEHENIDYAIAAAQRLAERATNWQNRQKNRQQ